MKLVTIYLSGGQILTIQCDGVRVGFDMLGQVESIHFEGDRPPAPQPVFISQKNVSAITVTDLLPLS